MKQYYRVEVKTETLKRVVVEASSQDEAEKTVFTDKTPFIAIAAKNERRARLATDEEIEEFLS